jgi:hypothetical protein
MASTELTTRTGTPAHLRSEDVIVQAPFSYVGSTKRILHAMMPWARRTVDRFHDRNGTGPQTIMRSAAVVGAYTTLYTTLVLAWTGVTCWYLTFGLLLVPYRLIRRSDRNRERQRLQHQELMAATFAAAQTRPDVRDR